LINNKLILSWAQDTITPLKRITFTQNSNIIQYTLSNFARSFEVPFRDFAAFVSGSATVTVASAYSSLNGLSGKISAFSTNPWKFTFIAGQHAFSEVSSTITLTAPIPWTVTVGATITVQGSATVGLMSKIVMEEPQNVVGYYSIS
jgi:hypothetical protein